MSSLSKGIKEFFGFIEEEEHESPLLSSPPKETQVPVQKTFRATVVNSKSKHINLAQIQVEEPRIYEDSLNIATYLRDNRPVIVNLKYLDSATGKRLIDFICGTAYAISGHMLKIAENIFLFTPAHVLISNSEQENSFSDLGSQEEASQPLQRQVSS